MAILESITDLDVKGRILATTVPNSTGSVVTWNSSTNVFGLRTNAQIIADLGLQSGLSSGLHTTVASNQVNVAFNDSTYVSDKLGNPRLYVSSTAPNNDMLFRLSQADGMFRYNTSTNTPIGTLQATTGWNLSVGNYSVGEQLPPALNRNMGTAGGWARNMMSISHSGTDLDLMGYFGSGSTITYGYIGGLSYSSRNAIRWSPNGFVGIGLASTTSPTHALEVLADAEIGAFVRRRSGSVTAGSFIGFGNNDTVYGNVGFNNDNFYVRSSSANTLQFRVSNASGVMYSSALTGTGNRLLQADLAGGVFATNIDPTTLITTSNIGGYIPSAQNLSINATIAGQIDISNGGTSATLNALSLSNRQDANIRASRSEFTPYLTVAGTTNYPNAGVGTGFRLERFSNATSQLGMDFYTTGVDGEVFLRTFAGTSSNYNWQTIATREYITAQNFLQNITGGYLEKASLAVAPVAAWDTILENRIVHSTSAANSPFTQYGIGMNFGGVSNAYRAQLFFNTNPNTNSLQFRTGSATGWLGVETVATQSWVTTNFPIGNYVSKTGDTMSGALNFSTTTALQYLGVSKVTLDPVSTVVSAGSTGAWNSGGVFLRPIAYNSTVGQWRVGGVGNFEMPNDGSGYIARTSGNLRTFNKVYQNYIQGVSTGILSIKFPQVSTGATMFDVTIKFYSYQLAALAELRVSFYRQSNNVINATAGMRALLTKTSTFPTEIVSVGIDANGMVSINIGESATAWSNHLSYEVERVETKFTGYNADWGTGWTSAFETSTAGYIMLHNVPVEVLRSGNNNYVSLDSSIPNGVIGSLADYNTIIKSNAISYVNSATVNRPNLQAGFTWSGYNTFGDHGFKIHGGINGEDNLFYSRILAGVNGANFQVASREWADGKFALASSIPTVNNGLLTISTSADLTGGGTFSANQATASNVPIGLSAGTLANIALGVTANSWGNHAGKYIANIPTNATNIPTTAVLDFNTVTGGGIYNTGVSATNTPDGTSSKSWMLLSMYRTSVDSAQIAVSTGGSGYGSIYYRPRISNAWLELIHTGNLDAQTTALGYIKSGSVPSQINLIQGAGIGITGTYPNLTITNTAPNVQANNGLLTLATGAGLTGGGTFSADQATAANFTVGIDSGYVLPTTAQVAGWNAKGNGTVTSVAMTAPTGLTVTGSPITSTGTLVLGYASGYQGYTTAEATKLAGLNNYVLPNASATVLGGIKVGSNLSIDANGVLSATNTNTTYTAGTGLSLTGTVFGQTITTSGTGTFVTGITQTTNGFQVNLGTPPNTVYTAGTGITIASNVITNSAPNATHTGDVAGATVLTIATNAVTNLKMAQMPTMTIKGNASVGTANPIDLTPSQVLSMLGIQAGANNYTHPNHSGDVTSLGDGATTIVNNAVTFPKIQNIATATFLGRNTAGTGNVEALTVAQMQSLLGFSTQTLSNSASNLIVSNTVQRAALTGDVTAPQNSNATTIANGVVTNAKMANMGIGIKGRNTGTGAPLDLTVAQVQAMLGVTTVNNGSFTVQGTGALTGTGSTSANASANTTADLDLTQATKDAIQQGVTVYNEFPSVKEGVSFNNVSTPFTTNISIITKKTIVNISAGVINGTVQVEDGLYDGYELAFNGCGEWSIDVDANIQDKCGIKSVISLSGDSALFWWSANDMMWIQAI